VVILRLEAVTVETVLFADGVQRLVTVQRAQTSDDNFLIVNSLVGDVVDLAGAQRHDAMVPLSPGDNTALMHEGSGIVFGQLGVSSQQVTPGDDHFSLGAVNFFLRGGEGHEIHTKHHFVDARHEGDLIAFEVPTDHASVFVVVVEVAELFSASDQHLS